MKKQFLLLGAILFGVSTLAQQAPTNTAPAGAGPSGQNNQQFWSRAGNNPSLGSNNIFGTLWNSPIYIQTNGLNRGAFFATQTAGVSPNWVNPLPSGGGMSINFNPAAPIRNPLSLLHIGEGPSTVDDVQGGYRAWMQVGTYYGYQSDQMYVGMKRETSSSSSNTDRTDAIINWGDNTTIGGAPNQFGPDYLRFIFTARRANASENTFAAGENGLEVMRVATNGNIGMGNFYDDPLFPVKAPATRLEILSNKTAAVANGTSILRLTHTQQVVSSSLTTGKFTDFEPTTTGDLIITARDNTQGNTLDKFLKERFIGVNTNTPGNTVEINSQLFAFNTANGAAGGATGAAGLRFTDLRSGSVPQANPGAGLLSVDANGDVIYVQANVTGGGILGAPCSNTTAGAGALSNDTKVNLNNFNLYFTNNGTSVKNRVAIGYNCGLGLLGKFNVLQSQTIPTIQNTFAGVFTNTDIAINLSQAFTGVQGYAAGNQTIDRSVNIGGNFVASSAKTNYGARGNAFNGNWVGSSFNYGGDFRASGNDSYGVSGIATGTNVSYGVYGSGGPGGNTANYIRAGYFSGLIEANASLIVSDQQFKTNVNDINSALKIVNLLKPKSYFMDVTNYPEFNFGSQRQYGFIAQEVLNVIPELIHNSYHPAEYDSLGSEISPATSYISMNYNGIIPINTQAIIELNQKVEKATLSDQSIKTNVQDLTGSLNKVLNMHGVSYDWDQTVHPELNLDSVNHIGFIAQEMAQIDSRVTYLADDSLLHIEYDKVVPLLAEAIQELNDTLIVRDSIITAQGNQINDLNDRLSQLENCLSGILPFLCQMSQSAVQANTPQAQEAIRTELTVRLSNQPTIILDQNVPNPFAEQTIINFSIPETVKKAQIHFYDGMGKLLQSVDVVERGLGSITVFGSDLSNGIYTFTLVADGQIVATKKMMKQ